MLADDELQWREVEPTLRSARWQRLNQELDDLGIKHVGLKRSDVVDEYRDAMAPVAIPVTDDDDSSYGPDSYFARAMNRDD